MGDVEAKRDIVTGQDPRHVRHTVSLLADRLVFTSKYRGKVLEGEVAEAAEENISLEKKALSKKQVSSAYGVVPGVFVGATLLPRLNRTWL